MKQDAKIISNIIGNVKIKPLHRPKTAYTTMGQGTSRLNWVCSCEDGKFNLTATYEEQKFSPKETPAEQHEEKKSQTKNNHGTNENISTGKDILLPIMDVETSIDNSGKGTKLRRTYSSCDLVYTKPGPDSKRIHGKHSVKSNGNNNKNSQQYRSHEVLSSAGSSSTNTESSGLSQSNSENSLNSTKSVDSKLHRMLGTSNLQRIKREQNDNLIKQKSNNASTSQQPTPERKLSINSSTSTGSTDRKSSIGDISSLSELLKKKKKEARRAEIVAAVTKRLYDARKKVDVKPEPVEVVPEKEDNLENDDELEELKLCSRARTRLQEISKRALYAHRGRMKRYSDVEAQTDFDKHVLRVKEVAVSTDENYHPPSMLFLENKNFLLTNCSYPSMRQPSPWSTVSVRNHNSLPYEDNFSDDSLDSNHEMDVTEHKPSLWDVISISSGRQFKTNGSDIGYEQISKNISIQTSISPNNDDTTVSVLEQEEMDNFNICVNGTEESKQKNYCEHTPIVGSDVISELEQTVDFCNCRESSENKSHVKPEGPFLNEIDRHLYTITENSELSDCNDLSSSDFENSYILNCNMNQKTVTVIEKSENLPNVQVNNKDTSFCKLPENNHKSCQTCTCNISETLFNETCPSCPALCAADTYCRNHNLESYQYKDKTTQTTKNKKSDTVPNTANKITDTEINKETRQYYQITGIPDESYRKMCKKCGKFQTGTHRLVDGVKNIQTKSVQCALNNLPSNVSTQTNSTGIQFPNLSVLCSSLLGAYHQLLQLSYPSLQSEDCIGIFFSGQSSQPTVMKPIHWGREQQYDTVGIQTDQNVDCRPAEVNSHHMKMQDDRIRDSKRKTKTRHKSLPQFASEQSTSHQLDATSPHTEELQARYHRKTGENSSTTDSMEVENFSDEEDAPLLPRTVGSIQGTEASGYQHWTEIKNLILGTDGNLFPYNITIDDKSSPVRHPKNMKKKSVSWSDLRGCGALETEMVFTSDHNLFDSSQASQSKITKSSLLDIIATEPKRSSHQRQVKTSELDGCRRQSRKLRRRWSLTDVKDLSSKEAEGKLQLSTFLKEASALVSGLSQATRLLEKGHQLNIRSSQPDRFNSIHNELWLSDDGYFNYSPPFETQFSYPSSMSLPTIMPSDEYDYGRPMFRKNSFRHRNHLRKFKDCNINTQIRLNQDHWNRRKASGLCEEVNRTATLQDCSILEANKWCSCCYLSTCPNHHSIPNLTTILDNDSSFVKSHSLYSSYMLSSPRAYRQHLVAIRRQIIKASLPITSTQ